MLPKMNKREPRAYNPYNRFLPASAKNAILITRKVRASEREEETEANPPSKRTCTSRRVAEQYGSPKPDSRTLVNIKYTSPQRPGDLPTVTADTPGGSKMTATRSYGIHLNGLKNVALIFSPAKPESEPTTNEKPSISTARVLSKIFATESQTLKVSLSGRDLALRQKKPRKSAPSQNTIMKTSAAKAVSALLSKLKRGVLPNEIKKDLKNKKWEWLHGVAWSLSPASVNPQKSENLSAGSKDENTYMMVLEYLTKKLLTKLPHFSATYSVQTLRTELHKVMLEVTQVVQFEAQGQEIKVTHSGKPLERDAPPKAKDADLLAAVIEAICNQKGPTSAFVATRTALDKNLEPLLFRPLRKTTQRLKKVAEKQKKKPGKEAKRRPALSQPSSL